MATPTHHLPDPRQYHPQTALNNRLVFNAQSALSATSADDRELWLSALRDAIEEMLARGELLSISVALAMVPSQACYQVVWEALRAVVEQTGNEQAIVFALPLVLVAGSKQQTTLPSNIADIEGLSAILRQYGVFSSQEKIVLSDALLSAESLVALDAAQLYRLSRQPENAFQLLAQQTGSAITVQEEGVFLRYLLGVARQTANAPPALRLGGAVTSWGMPVMKFLGEQLGRPELTLFPIARPPMPVMQAMVAGNFARFEVALQVYASSRIRQLREQNLEPVATLAAHESGELRISLAAQGLAEAGADFVWPLAALDNLALIEENFAELMAECHVREVQVLPNLQTS